MTRYSKEMIQKMLEQHRMQSKLRPFHNRFKDKTIEEIREMLELEELQQEDQTNNK